MIKNTKFQLILFVVVILSIVFFPYNKKFLGVIQQNSQRTITVTGEASKITQNQVASFSAGVSVVKDNKEEAVKEVNEKVAKLIADLKAFGISPSDIKTQNLSIYQREETYYEDGKSKSRQGQWSVSNTVDVKLRKIEKSSELANLLAESGANNVYGPNFEMDDTTIYETELLNSALINAKKKAGDLLIKQNSKLGNVVSIIEGNSYGNVTPVFDAKGIGGGGGAPIEQGSAKITKSVTVVFEIE